MPELEGSVGSAGLLIICTMIARKRHPRRLKEKVQAKVARIPRGKEKAKKAEKAAKREKVKEKARTLRKNRRTETEAGPFLMNLRAG